MNGLRAGRSAAPLMAVARVVAGVTSLTCQKPTMVDANDLPPKRPECLSRLAPRRGYLARISSLQRRSTEPTQHDQRRS
jgi:hypothetical protein